MHPSLGFGIIFFIILIGCKTDKRVSEEVNAEPETAETQTPVDEDDLILRLSVDLHSEPANQAEKDQNTIINYAIDNLLDLQSTRTGLYYQILREGEGDLVKWGDYIKAHYRGRLLNGKEFDSSYKKGQPMQFYVGNMIDGWNEGLQLIRPGGKALFVVPSGLAYGEEGLVGPSGKILILPNEVLVFEVEVIKE